MSQSLESIIIEHIVSDNVSPIEDLYAYVQSCLGKQNRINDYFISQIDALDFNNIAATVSKLSSQSEHAETARLLLKFPTLASFIGAVKEIDSFSMDRSKARLDRDAILNEVAAIMDMPDTGVFEFITFSSLELSYLAFVTKYAVTLIREGDKYRVGVFDCFLPSVEEEESFHSKACDSYAQALETFVKWSQVAYKIDLDEEDAELEGEDYDGPTLIDALELLTD